MAKLECVDLILITKQWSPGCVPPQNSDKITLACFNLKLISLTEISLWSTARNSHHEKLPLQAPQCWALPHRHFLVSTWTSDGYWGPSALTTAIYHFIFSFYSCFTDFWSLHLTWHSHPVRWEEQGEVMTGDQRWGKSRQPPQAQELPIPALLVLMLLLVHHPDAIRWQHVLWQGDTFNSTLWEKALPPVYFSPAAS